MKQTNKVALLLLTISVLALTACNQKPATPAAPKADNKANTSNTNINGSLTITDDKKSVDTTGTITITDDKKTNSKDEKSATDQTNLKRNEKIIGSWVDTTDPKSELTITQTDWISSYDKDKSTETTSGYYFANECETTPSKGGNPAADYITVDDKDGPFCFYIVKLDDKNMELSYVGRGNTLTYKRK